MTEPRLVAYRINWSSPKALQVTCCWSNNTDTTMDYDEFSRYDNHDLIPYPSNRYLVTDNRPEEPSGESALSLDD